jgi:suppressor for copper-sensitivity B
MAHFFISLVTAFFIVFCNISGSFAKPVITPEATINLIAGKNDNEGNITAGLHFKLEEGWKIYWREAGDTGFPPQLNWQSSSNISSMDMYWPAPTRERYKLMDNLYSESYEYADEVLFPLEFKANDFTKDSVINLNVYYAICKDICIPANVDLSAKISKGYESNNNIELIENFSKLVPKPNNTNGISINSIALGGQNNDERYLQITVNSESIDLDSADIFIESDGDYAFFNPDKYIQNNNKKVIFNVPFKALSDEYDLENNEYKVTLSSGTNSIEAVFNGSEFIEAIKLEKPKNSNLDSKVKHSDLIILLFAFLGGLILNVMPCVLPVLSIKLISIIKHGGGNKAHVASSFIITAIGIITSFLALGALVYALKLLGVSVGWGFHFQQPLFIITLIVILSLFAANMWGFYELRLPAFISNNAMKKGDGEGVSANFFTGVFAAILATPCTAPFLGTAVGFAMSGSMSNIFTVFFMMGLGMSIPYITLSIFPSLVTKMPKPGYWMVIVKFIMGCFIALTAIWLIWVLSGQLGIISSIVLAFIITLILLLLHFDQRIFNKNKLKYLVYSILIALAFVSPTVLKQKTESSVIDNEIWQELKISEIDSYVSNGRVVFVDVTADWCLTCKANKLLVLDRDGLIKVFKENNVIALRADWTNRNNKIAEYLAKYDRAGIPFNIIYGPSAPNGIILSELLNKEDIVKTIEKAKAK